MERPAERTLHPEPFRGAEQHRENHQNKTCDVAPVPGQDAITGDGSTASMTLVSPERALPADLLPLDFVLEDAVRAITVMILPMG